MLECTKPFIIDFVINFDFCPQSKNHKADFTVFPAWIYWGSLKISSKSTRLFFSLRKVQKKFDFATPLRPQSENHEWDFTLLPSWIFWRFQFYICRYFLSYQCKLLRSIEFLIKTCEEENFQWLLSCNGIFLLNA